MLKLIRPLCHCEKRSNEAILLGNTSPAGDCFAASQ